MQNNKNDWAILSKKLHDELNQSKRDALVPYVISNNKDLENTRDLYEKLLIDVEMSSCGTTSKIKEAIAAVQLYFHRYFVNLENLEVKNNDEEEIRQKLKKWWKWMKNYRVWEANRKVFLYPENYIRPELRDTKTPAFKTLEEDLLQDEITEESVEKAYKKYLDEYTEVSRLEIAGGYVYKSKSDEDEENLILFGKTKTDPKRYYYRFAKFMSDSIDWKPWLSVNIQIDADRVYPIYAFERVFVFWTKVETRVDDTNNTNITTREKGNTQSIVSNKQETECIKIFYSFYNLNEEWVSPQELTEVIEIKDLDWKFFIFDFSFDFKVTDVRLFVQNSEDLIVGENNTSKHENILINCTYDYSLKTVIRQGDDVIRVDTRTIPDNNQNFSLTPELYTKPSNSSNNNKSSLIEVIKKTAEDIFDRSEEDIFNRGEIDLNKIVMFNTLKESSDAPWFSFDLKGGSFLCKPIFDFTPEPIVIDEILQKLGWNQNDVVAVKIPKGTIYIFKDRQYVTVENDIPGEKKDINKRWGKVRTNIATEGIVDAALFDGNKTYLFSGKEYLVYSNGHELADFGYPKLLENNNESLPNWDKIDAAFSKNGKNYFFRNKPDNDPKFIVSDALTEERSTKEFWGKLKNNFTELGDNKHLVDAAFVFGDYTYLINQNYFIKYKNDNYELPEWGSPKRHNFHSVLEDLECQNNSDTYKQEKIYAASDVGSDIYFFTTDGDNANQYLFSNGRIEKIDDETDDKGDDRDDENDVSLTAMFAIGNITYKFKKITDDEEKAESKLFVYDRNEPLDLASIINAAFVGKDNKIYLFKRNTYISFPLADATPETIVENINKWNYSQNIKGKWGKQSNNIGETGIVDAAFYDGNKIYLFSGDRYFVYSGDNGEIDRGYPQPIENNPNLPNWDEINAVLTTNENGKKYFFNNQNKTFVDSENLNNQINTADKWGLVRNNFTKNDAKVEKAYATSNALYLVNDRQYITYTLSPEEEPGVYIKGYPQSFNEQVESTLKSNYEIIRLTNSTAYKLNETLFLGGIPSLLRLATQEIDDIPAFSFETPTSEKAATTIKLKKGKVQEDKIPLSSHLDFNSANGIYYWEIFFHAPFLIAQSLNTAQKFAEAKEWYEYIFDPTEVSNYWKFLPFLAVDIEAIIELGRRILAQLKEFPNLADKIDEIEDIVNPIFQEIEPLTDVFLNLTQLSENQEQELKKYFSEALPPDLTKIKNKLKELTPPEDYEQKARFERLVARLKELTDIIGKIWYRYELLKVRDAEIRAYLNDPFDPHAIASLRKIAYRKAIVMAYIDNILDWGDMLFRQYTHESINEARMLYILAYDLLGQKPENSGRRILSEDKNYTQLAALPPNTNSIDTAGDLPKKALSNGNNGDRKSSNLILKPLIEGDEDYDFLVYPQGTVHDSIANPYFFIPENPLFNDYWTRVEDRLYKIRHCLNIMGISQPLPLFEPPINPMALVRAASSGAGLSAALAGLAISVPHYRFSFMIRKAQELVAKLTQFGSELLATLEKKDAEELSMLQNRQEGMILAMTRSIKAAQLSEAEESMNSLKESLNEAQIRFKHYEDLIDKGLLQREEQQKDLTISAGTAYSLSSVLNASAIFTSAAPDTTLGPFITGIKFGGSNLGSSLSNSAQASESGGEALSTAGEVLGILASHDRLVEDWKLQKDMAASEKIQIEAQLAGAEFQKQIAQQEIVILEKEIEHNESVETFMREKYSNAQLYQWMASKLSGIFYQTYQMAYDMAKAAEKAFQFERGLKESEVNFINGHYWDSQKKGLLAGESLGLDLDRMEKAYIETDSRSFEISKNISLLELDPVALIQLKSKGVCEFAFSEALFDYDFPGHYSRQIKTISLAFDVPEGQTVMATLTQLNHKTILEPDPKAVKYLLDPKEQQPESIRSNWRASQQIALSAVEEFEKNNGLFELRFVFDDRYLPFEGTGAVSTWRLELSGKKGSYNVNELLDITINLKYSARQGGAVFAKAVKGMLKPYQTVRFFDMHYDFPEEWNGFLDSDSNELILPFSRELFPNMASGKISGIFSKFDLYRPGAVSMTLNNQDDLTLNDGKYLLTNGLSISSQGADWIFTIAGDKTNLRNINLVLGYKATVT